MLDCTTVFSYQAPAKLNLFLHICGVRADGYHQLQTLFQLLDYYDELDIRLRSDGQLHFDCDVPIAERNLVVQAAQLLQAHASPTRGADICLRKRIPLGAGLGGGSSDAATTLLALNHLWDCQLSQAHLLRCGRQLGADVALFIGGHSAWAEGVGELLQPVELPHCWYVVFVPPLKVATAAMYQRTELKRDYPQMTMADYQAGRTHNAFQEIVARLYPIIGHGIRWLGDYAEARLTGSGGAFFGSCSSEAQAHDLLERCPLNLSGFVARGINQSPLLNEKWIKKV